MSSKRKIIHALMRAELANCRRETTAQIGMVFKGILDAHPDSRVAKEIVSGMAELLDEQCMEVTKAVAVVGEIMGVDEVNLDGVTYLAAQMIVDPNDVN